MASSVPRAADEGRHRPGPGPWWIEWWELVFWTQDSSLAGSVRLTLVPGARRAWYWADLVGVERPLVAARDDEVEMPRGGGLEVRAEGLWSTLTCETPLEHWSVGLEAFAVALDDPDEALGQARGDRLPMGLDLEWEADAGARDTAPLGLQAGGNRYEQPALVHGEVLIGSERVALECPGWRVRGWGQADWTSPWSWTASRLHRAPGPSPGQGAVVEAVGRAPVEVRDPGLETRDPGPAVLGRLERSLCRVGRPDGDGEPGWSESYRPAGRVSPDRPR